MKHLYLIAALLSSLLTIATPATAQNAPANMHAAVPLVAGEIRKVDTEAGKITIRHGEIPNLDMPAMTMVFRVASPEMTARVKAGDQVLFSAEKIDGALTVTTLEVPPEK